MVQSNFLGTEFTIYDRGMSGVTALSPKGARPTHLPQNHISVSMPEDDG